MARTQELWRKFKRYGRIEPEKICDPAALCAIQRSLDLIQGDTENLQQGSVLNNAGIMLKRLDAFVPLNRS